MKANQAKNPKPTQGCITVLSLYCIQFWFYVFMFAVSTIIFQHAEVLLCLYFLTIPGRTSLENSAQCLIDNIKENAASWPFCISNHVSKMIFSLSTSVSSCFFIKGIMSLHNSFYAKINYHIINLIINYYNYCS